jgi:dephospho-CoA kinase
VHVYGLTGGIGAGKSAVAELLEEYGIPVVSADELSRMVVAPGTAGLADVVTEFGSEVLDDRGELDRRAMGSIVFGDPAKRKKLENILHPRIRERYEQVLDALEKAGHPVMVYEVPLLFEKGLQGDVKAVILVSASDKARIARVQARDGLNLEEIEARMAAQMPEKEKRAKADYIIHNDGSLDDLREEVERMISRFLKLPPRLRRDEEPAPTTTRNGAEPAPLPSEQATWVGPAPKSPPPPPSATPTEPGVPVPERAPSRVPTVPPGGSTKPASATPTVPPDAPAPPLPPGYPAPPLPPDYPPPPIDPGQTAKSDDIPPPPIPAKGPPPPPPKTSEE